MLKTLAKIISYLFHPLLIPTYLILLIGVFFPAMLSINPEHLLIVVAMVLCFTFVMPALNMLTFRVFGTISSLTLENRQERVIPFFFIAVIYGIVCYLFYFKLPFSVNFNKLVFISTLLVIASAVATIFFKVSIHSLAICGALGILITLNKATETSVLLWPTALAIVVAGAVMSSRLLLNAHTPREVMWGALIGFGVSFSSMIILF